MTAPTALVISVALLALNGFFVAAEFALVAAKQHRLDAAAASGGMLARAARRAKGDLPLMLAGAQLGITLCSLGLGALAEPAIAHAIEPLLTTIGFPDPSAYVIAFVIALAIVVFLHIVIGEMAPKSWAISDPERAAISLAAPFLLFTRVVRPALVALNGAANLTLRPLRIPAQGTLPQAHGPEELQLLLRQSREEGHLEAEQHRMLTAALQIQRMPISAVARPRRDIISVSIDASLADAEAVSRETGRSRLLVIDKTGEFIGLVHIRDLLKAQVPGSAPRALRQLMTKPLRLAATTDVATAMTTMRADRAQLALTTMHGRDIGLVALEDLLEQVIGQFEDETDADGAVGWPTTPGRPLG